MNPEIIKGQVRSILIFVGGIVSGLGFGKSWFTPDQITGFFSNETVVGIVAAVAGMIWSGVTHRESNAVAVVTAMARDPASPVKAVVVEPTPAGRELVRAVTPSEPGSKAGVVIAGTPAAASVAH